MASRTESNDLYFAINWHIMNFNFCWHKTGEYIESPLFHINIPGDTSWRLWLYPRGEVDGEYISCHLFRGEGGPDVVDVDFSLYLYVEDTLVTLDKSFTKIYSFRKFQRMGLECFALRSEIFAPTVAQQDTFTLILGCKIFHPQIEADEIDRVTKINMERLSGCEIIDDDAELDPEKNKDIEIKPILGGESLLNINLSYVDEYLIVKVRPANCAGIKYATFKIVVVKNWEKTTPIEHVSSWIGEIETDVVKFHVPSLPEAECTQPGGKKFISKAFFLYYDFTFSNGLEIEIDESLTKLNFSFLRSLDTGTKIEKSAPTAVEALVDVYRSESYVDMFLATKTNEYPAHKAILIARSPSFMSKFNWIKSNLQFHYINDSFNQKFLNFFYTDQVELDSVQEALGFFHLADLFEIKLLEMKCFSFLKCRLDMFNIFDTLEHARYLEHRTLMSVAEDFILRNYALILGSRDFRKVTEKYFDLRKIIILMKYKKIKTRH